MSELPFRDPPLGDAVVRLRSWTSADLPGNVMKFADPLVHEHSWPHVAAYTGADATEFFAAQDAARALGTELNLALVDPADPPRVLGGGSLYDVDLEVGRAAVGYWLAADARGRGVATHATWLIAGWAFDRLGVKRLELHCGPDNIASQQVALRCGFTREGVLRSHTPFKGRPAGHRHLQPARRRAAPRARPFREPVIRRGCSPDRGRSP